MNNAFALAGRFMAITSQTQGVALGYALLGFQPVIIPLLRMLLYVLFLPKYDLFTINHFFAVNDIHTIRKGGES